MRWLLLLLLLTTAVDAQVDNETAAPEDEPVPAWATNEVRLGMAALGLLVAIGAFVLIARR